MLPRRRSWFAAAAAVVLVAGALVPMSIGVGPAQADVSISGVVNSYQKVSAVSGNTVTVTGGVTGAGGSWAVGDRVMLIQMTGVAPVHAGSNMGNYDNATITAISGSNITLSAVSRNYEPGTQAVQLVRVIHDPGTVTVSGTVTAKAWDGSTGGVVALSGGTLNLDANIDTSATGFTNLNTPTGTMTAATADTACVPPATGQGQPVGRGGPAPAAGGGLGGGGIDGGGGTTKKSAAWARSWGGAVGCGAYLALGTNGGNANGQAGFGGAWAASSGGGGVTGGGGGGGAGSLFQSTSAPTGGGGGGGGVNGGGAGGYESTTLYALGGGGTMGVGNGGNGFAGTSSHTMGDGSAGGGGGSYGGGGGAASNNSGGDNSNGGGGGGGWTGGGTQGSGPSGTTTATAAGGAGNTAVSDQIPDSRHYLHLGNPRLMMGGAGGTGSAYSGSIPGGAGGGIVYADFTTISGAGDIVSNGGVGASPLNYGGGAKSGAGGGGGGQMRIRAKTIATDGVLTVAARGGVGGTGSSNTTGCTSANCHGGVSGAGGGAGGIWVELVGAVAACPAPSTEYNIEFDLDGGAAGPSVLNPKNNMQTGTGGDGGTGLGCISSPPQQLIYEKTSNPAPGTVVKPGDEITYTVTVENVTTSPVTDGLLTDDMSDVLDKASLVTPPTLTCDPAANQCGEVSYTSGATEFTWHSDAVPMQGSTTATITYKVKLNVDDPATPENEAAVGNVGNVLVEPDIHVDHPILTTGKESDPESGTRVNPGQTVTYTIWFENTGDVPATGQTFTDDLSAVLDKAKLVPNNTNPTLTVTSVQRGQGGAPDVPGGAIGTATFDGTAGQENIEWNGDLPAHTRVSVEYSVVVNADDSATPADEGATGELRNVFLDHGTEHPISATLTWNKVDAVTGALLEGSVWKLTPVDDNGDPDPSRDTIASIEDCIAANAADCTGHDRDNSAGKFRINGLVPGEYLLEELEAPDGYVVLDNPITVMVRDDASVTFHGDIENEAEPEPVSLEWTKTDGTDRLAGSEWKLSPVVVSGTVVTPDGTRVGVNDITDCIAATVADCGSLADRDPTEGGFRIDGLMPGHYHLEETKAPAGFVLLDAPILIDVTEGQAVTVHGDVVNEQQGVPGLPLTGGLGSDAFWIIGGTLGALTVGLLIWFEARSRRSRVTALI